MRITCSTNDVIATIDVCILEGNERRLRLLLLPFSNNGYYCGRQFIVLRSSSAIDLIEYVSLWT